MSVATNKKAHVRKRIRKPKVLRPIEQPSKQRLDNYNMTEEEYLVMLRHQGGVCAICQDAKATDIDHCHKVEEVRAILCGNCNRGLGAFKDNVQTLTRAIAYLTHGYHHEDAPQQYGHATSPYRSWGYHVKLNTDGDSDDLAIFRGPEHVADVTIAVPTPYGSTASIYIRRYLSLADLPTIDEGCTKTWNGDDIPWLYVQREREEKGIGRWDEEDEETD